MKKEAAPTPIPEASVLGVVNARDLCLGCGYSSKSVHILKVSAQSYRLDVSKYLVVLLF